jgi:ergothioneine biosynthesis protein EgtB
MSQTEERRDQLTTRYREVRTLTESLAAPLSPEDQTVQSMPDVSPTKWHRAHTSWFFETFLLEHELAGYRPFHPAYEYLFNSYYEAVGARHPRPERGLVSRPGVAEVAEYRRHVDRGMAALLGSSPGGEVLDLVELGVHHEQQHQELLLMDAKHVLSCNPLLPAYVESAPAAPADAPKAGWIEHQGGPAAVGHDGNGFAYDNESPRHLHHLTPYAIADRPVSCGEWLAFVEDGGYARPDLWLSDGWAAVQQLGWTAPLYWRAAGDGATGSAGGDGSAGAPGGTAGSGDGGWRVFTLGGERPLHPGEPVCHVSYYEADAFARWAGCRLPTEAEWEAIAADRPVDGNLLDRPAPHPAPCGPATGGGFFGDVWEWTASAYSPYPGFRPAAGAVGEYNGKFMVNQYVLRGGSCATPPGHVRPTYRNFFPAGARWAFSGVRLARDL